MNLPVNELTAVEAVEDEIAKLADQQIGNRAIETMQHVVARNDIDRIVTGATLLNTFNYAIQQQAGRDEWTPGDFRAFCIALSAMYDIKADK